MVYMCMQLGSSLMKETEEHTQEHTQEHTYVYAAWFLVNEDRGTHIGKETEEHTQEHTQEHTYVYAAWFLVNICTSLLSLSVCVHQQHISNTQPLISARRCCLSLCAHEYIYIHTLVYMCIYEYVCVCMFVCVCVCVCTRAWVYAHIQTDIQRH